MACVEYMRNFYNDMNFRTEAYAHFLGDVIMMCNQMIKMTYTKNTEVLNEILELYRFIVEKYASHGSQQAHIVALVSFLKEIWDFFIAKCGDEQSNERELTAEEENEYNELRIAQ
jgi:hypothetical protein